MSTTRISKFWMKSVRSPLRGSSTRCRRGLLSALGFRWRLSRVTAWPRPPLASRTWDFSTQTEMVERAQQICGSVKIPVIVDADTGYGNPLNVHRTVNQLIAAGAAGCFLEDQVWPKKCGHMRGKQIVARDDYINKIRAAVDARAGRDFFIVARTDALAVEGMEEALARVEAARGVGADASFIEAPDSLERLAEIGRRSPAPNVANMIEGGKTPVLPQEELCAAGVSPHSLSPRRAVCVGAGDRDDVPKAACRWDDHG